MHLSVSVENATVGCTLQRWSVFFPVGAEVLVTDEEARTPGPRLLRRAADGADIKARLRPQNERRETMGWREQGQEKWKQLAGRVDGDGAGADK